jgi:uncharacterized protein YhdP
MKKPLKVAGVVGIVLVFFLGALLFAFYHLAQVGEFRRFLISEVETRTQLKVQAGEAELEIGRVFGISFRDFALIKPQSGRSVIAAQRILVRVALLPLLKRRLVFYETRLYQPTLQLDRDKQGKISLPDWTIKLPFYRQEEGEFSLDLREIKVEDGQVVFLDQRQGQAPVVTHLREISLNLRRTEERGLLYPKSEAQPKIATPGEEGQAIEFRLGTTLERDGKRAGVRSTGRIFFPDGVLEPRQAWLDADIHVGALPADLVPEAYGYLLPLKTMRGTLDFRLRWQGSLAEQVHIKGEVDFKRLELDARDILTSVVAPGDGRLQLDMELRPQEIRFQRFDLRSKEITLALQGTLRDFGGKDPYLKVQLTTPYLSLLTTKKYIPSRIIKASKWQGLVNALTEGEMRLTRAGVEGRLSEVRRLYEPGFEGHIWLDAEVRGAGGDVKDDPYLPLKGVSGRIVLEKGVLYYKGFKGMYGQSRFTEIDGSHNGVLTGPGLLELRLRGEVDLRELREQLGLNIFPAQVTRAASAFQELGGKGRLRIFFREEPNSSYQYEGALSLDNGRVRIGDISLSQVRGDLSFSTKEIMTEKISALLAGSPLLIRGALRNYLSDRPILDLTFDSPGVAAGAVTHILLPSASLQDPGTVRGTLHYQGPLGPDRKLSGSLELVGVYLPLKYLSQPLHELHGRISLNGSGFDFQGIKGQLASYGFDLNGRWNPAEKPQLTFTLHSPEMDVTQLLPKGETQDDDQYDRLQIKGGISIDRGRYETFEFSDLKTDLLLAKRVWRLENFSARSTGGTVEGVGSFIDSPESLGLSIEPRIQGVPLKGLLSWFDIDAREITGGVNLTGKFESSGTTRAERKRNLTGHFRLEIKDGVARRLRLLVRILNLMDLTRWFSFQLPDFNQQGIRFRSVSGDFKVDKGVYSTENLVVDSDDLSITAAGQYDASHDVIDAVLALRPFPRVDSVLNYIPLIGTGIAGIKDSVLVASFRVRGPLDEATITPAPLSTLSEFFFSALKIPQKLITVPGGGKK